MKKFLLLLFSQLFFYNFVVNTQSNINKIEKSKNNKTILKKDLLLKLSKINLIEDFNFQDNLSKAIENKYQCIPVFELSALNQSVQLTGTTIVNEETIKLSNTIGKRITFLTNQYRASKGLKPLKWDFRLAKIGRGHTLQMARGVRPFSHAGFETRFARYRKIEPTTVSFGENLFYGYGFTTSQIARVAVNAWKNSPGHERNLTGNYNRTGVAAFRNVNNVWYITQLFALVR